MINVEGFKAFSGIMKVTPMNPNVKPFIIGGDFLYKPDMDCWYCKGRSFLAATCQILEDWTEREK